MKSKKKDSIVFIGAGNVATHLATEFHKQGHSILQVCSRTKESAEILGKKINSPWETSLSNIRRDAEIYFICVSDNSLTEVAGQLKLPGKLVLHTSGFHSLEIIKNISEKSGVFYPLQTFSKNRNADFSNIPILLQSENQNDLNFLKNLAYTISRDVRVMDSQQRRQVHLAAVFASNFTNNLINIAFDILKMNNLDGKIINALIIETAKKATEISPSNAQTGPAARGDFSVMEKHIEMLEVNDYKELYKKISRNIVNMKLRDHK